MTVANMNREDFSMCMEMYHGDEDLEVRTHYLGRAIKPSIEEDDYVEDDDFCMYVESKTNNEPAWA
ncbi:hypothetical protein UFOVP270_5 [uncultured Caudovirales phage]|uniref:Uncharacterized protein n=1 Tax=uncultured Caudovirales phage TaxID=2100421 RepID=A0A6J5L5R3_9CAUD|nr:hypothetical protein UFOVP101_51 [uncultured Caudovirales phage]CAB4134011.1 hypothetical protein UFOVP270_5 [uncultured Caudovirales phage]